MTLKSRNAIVTGSTSGIGLAIARALAKEGANIMINGMGDAAAIEAERAAIEKERHEYPGSLAGRDRRGTFGGDAVAGAE